MKTFLALLISCLTLSAATTYPVLTDSTSRLFPGGVTNVFFLNSNVVTTGTMRATGAVTLTNASNVFAGDGSGLTGISAGVSTSGGRATNLSVYSSGTTNRPLRVYTTNNSDEFYIDKNGQTYVPSPVPDNTLRGYRFAGWGSVIGINPGLGDGIIMAPAGSEVAFFLNNTSYGFAINDTFPLRFNGNSIIIRGNSSQSGYLAIQDGSSNYRDLALRSLFATNLYATNLIINGGAAVTKILSATATLNFDLTALTVEDLTITVTGAADGDVVTLGVPNGSITTSVQYTAWVSAADTVTVRARTSATGENPASGVFRATVIKH